MVYQEDILLTFDGQSIVTVNHMPPVVQSCQWDTILKPRNGILTSRSLARQACSCSYRQSLIHWTQLNDWRWPIGLFGNIDLSSR